MLRLGGGGIFSYISGTVLTSILAGFRRARGCLYFVFTGAIGWIC